MTFDSGPMVASALELFALASVQENMPSSEGFAAREEMQQSVRFPPISSSRDRCSDP